MSPTTPRRRAGAPDRLRARRRPRQRGAAALMVVMVLFFVISLVAAYASRNLIFEQRTSANQYRSTQAFEAAEAGIEWALGLLNSGRVDAACTPSVDAAQTSFGQRYLNLGTDGSFVPRTRGDGTALRPSCVRTAAGWACSCPVDGAPVLAEPTGVGSFPAFRLQLFPVGTPAQPGLIRIESRGCTRLNEVCMQAGLPTSGDALAVVSQVVAFRSGLATPPPAALTLQGTLAAGSVQRVVNTDPATNGITLNARPVIDTATRSSVQLASVPGSPPEASVVDGDGSIPAHDAARPDRLFAAIFGMRASTYRLQPAAVVLDCAATSCSAAALRSAATLNPGRPLWVRGDLDMDSNGDLGSPASPVVLVVDGNLVFSAATVRIYGLVHVRRPGADWSPSGSALLQGAVVAEGGLAGASAVTVQYDPAILERLRRGTGSFVRVPGGWKDF